MKLFTDRQLLVTGVLVFVSTCAAVAQTARIEVSVVGYYGTPRTDVNCVLIPLDRSGPAEIRMPGCEASRVPYGNYVLRVSNRSAREEKRVRVDRESVWLTIGAPILEIDGTSVVLAGEVRALSAAMKGPVWSRLISVYGRTSKETRLEQDGTFRFDRIPGGVYIVLILSPEGVLASQTVTLRHGTLRLTLNVDRSQYK